MKLKAIVLGPFFLLLLSSCSDTGMVVNSGPWRFRQADTMEEMSSVPKKMGEYWLETTFRIEDTLDVTEPYGVIFSMLGSSEVYWDGQFIGNNGKVGQNTQTEIPGKLVKVFLVPPRLLQPGIHKVKIHFSNFHSNNKVRFYGLSFGTYWVLARSNLSIACFFLTFAGLFLIVGIYYCIRFGFNTQQIKNLLFGLISLALFLLVLLEFMRRYYHYDYPWHFPRLQLILGITLFIGVALPLFYSIHFNSSTRARVFLLSGIGLLMGAHLYWWPVGYDPATMGLMLIGILASILVVITAVRKKKKGSLYVLIGLLPITLSFWGWGYYYDYLLFIGFGFLTILMLVILGMEDRDQRRFKEQALLRSSRLETQLLKKNIQPHFLMNSLTAVIDWMEENPLKGIELLYSLIEEFDIMLRISDKKLIPIQEEIALCKAHVSVMSFRKEKNYSIETQGILDSETLPPAILLTLIENGITHNSLLEKEIPFLISFEQNISHKNYRVWVKDNMQPKVLPSTDGTGSKYIKARLEESFTGKWQFSSKAVEGGWESIIGIRK